MKQYIVGALVSGLLCSGIATAQSSTSSISLNLLQSKTTEQQLLLEQRVEKALASITLPNKTRNLLYSILVDFKEMIARPGASELAQCLTTKGWKMYGTDRCPHCIQQKVMFGEVFQQIKYVECDQQPELCADKKITAYPTWISPTGEQIMGTQSRDALAQSSSCDVPEIVGWNDIVDVSFTIKDTKGKVYIDGVKQSFGFGGRELDNSTYSRRHARLIGMTEGETKSIQINRKNISYVLGNMLSGIGLQEISYNILQVAGIEPTIGSTIDLGGLKGVVKEVFDRSDGKIVLIDLYPTLRNTDVVVEITVKNIRKTN